jgi:WD40 repeat protein
MGTGVDHQQVGNTWVGPEGLVSLSMSGHLNVFDRRVGDKPSRILYGPTKGITKAVQTSNGTLFVGDSSGRVTSFTPNGDAQPLKGDGHAGPVTGLAVGSSSIFSTGFDDSVREIDLATSGFKGASSGTNGQPKGIAVDESGTAFVCTLNGIEAVKDGKRVASLNVKYSPGAIDQKGKLIAVGGEDQTIYLYEWDGSQFKESAKLENSRGRVTALAFSPDGSLLAAGDSSGKMMLHNVIERKLVTSNWSFHTASVNSISWFPDGQRCATGSLDTHVVVWSVASPMNFIAIRNAGAGGVSAVQWLTENKLSSAGADGCVRTWEITF